MPEHKWNYHSTEIAEKFNNFFVNIATEIEKTIPPAIPNTVPIPITEPEFFSNYLIL